MTTSVVAVAFATLVETISTTAPEGGVREALLAQVHRLRDSPPTDELEQVLRRRISRDRALALLFAPEPTADSIGVYAELLSPAHPHATVRAAALGLCFLVHAHSWSLAAELVRAGGLVSVVALLDTASGAPAILRSQALEVLHLCTSNPAYDWFSPPSVADDDAALHRGLLFLARTAFLPSLCACRASPPFPGASLLALQLLAFWLSWARKLHTGGAPLRLSRGLLSELRAWAGGGEATASAAGEGGGSGGGAVEGEAEEGKEEDERGLAARLLADFSRFPPAGEEEGSDAAAAAATASSSVAAEDGGAAGGANAAPAAVGAASVSGVVWSGPSDTAQGGDLPTPAVQTAGLGALPPAMGVAATTPSTEPPVSGAAAADRLREAANAAFRAGAWQTAIDGYSDALGRLRGEGGGAFDSGSSSDRSLRITLLSNRALARLRAAGYGSGASPDERLLRATRSELQSAAAATAASAATTPGGSVPLLLAALDDCDAALALDGSHAKSAVRRAQALAALHRFDDARAAARAAQRTLARVHAGGGGDPSSLAQISALLATLSVCAEAAAAALPVDEAARTPHPSPAAQQADSAESSILAALSLRREFGGAGIAPGDRPSDYLMPASAARAPEATPVALPEATNPSDGGTALHRVGGGGGSGSASSGVQAPAVSSRAAAAQAPLVFAPSLPDFGTSAAVAGQRRKAAPEKRIVQLGF